MASRTKQPTHVLAILKLPEAKTPQVVIMARHIHESMSQNPWFPTPRPPLAKVLAAIEALAEAQVTSLTRARGTAEARDARRADLVSLLQQLQSHVQGIADRNPEQALSIIQGAGMFVKRQRATVPRVFAALPWRNQGSVKIVAPRVGNRPSYEWQISFDGARTWTALPVTNTSTMYHHGLTLLTKVWFRYRVTVKNVTGDWSEPLEYSVR